MFFWFLKNFPIFFYHKNFKKFKLKHFFFTPKSFQFTLVFNKTLFSFSIKIQIQFFIQIKSFSKWVQCLNWLIYLTLFCVYSLVTRRCCCLCRARKNRKHKSKKRIQVVNHKRNLCCLLHQLTKHELFWACWERIQSATKKNCFLMNSSFRNVHAVNFNRHKGVVRRH